MDLPQVPEEGTEQRQLVMAAEFRSFICNTQNSERGGEEEADEEEQRAEERVRPAGGAGPAAERVAHEMHGHEEWPSEPAEGDPGLSREAEGSDPAHPERPDDPGYHDSYYYHRGVPPLATLDQAFWHSDSTPCWDIYTTSEDPATDHEQQLTPPRFHPSRPSHL